MMGGLIGGLVCIWLWVASGHAQANDKRPVLEVGYTDALAYDVADSDSRTATRTWVKAAIDRAEVEADAEALIFQDLPSLVRAVNAKELDLAILLPLEFLEIRDRAPLLPLLTTSSRGSIPHEYVLLVSGNCDTMSLAGLLGKTLILDTGGKGRLPGMWLDVLLRRTGLPDRRTFFSSVREVTGTSRAVMPVFFGQADACVVTREGLETMVELNPQLGDALGILAVSPGFLRDLVCMREDVYERYGDTIMASLLSLHDDPQGRQLLRLFHVDEVVRIEAGFLDLVIALSEEYDDLMVESQR